MTLNELNARIAELPPEDAEEAQYLMDERLGMLCGAGIPDAEQMELVTEQLLPRFDNFGYSVTTTP